MICLIVRLRPLGDRFICEQPRTNGPFRRLSSVATPLVWTAGLDFGRVTFALVVLGVHSLLHGLSCTDPPVCWSVLDLSQLCGIQRQHRVLVRHDLLCLMATSVALDGPPRTAATGHGCHNTTWDGCSLASSKAASVIWLTTTGSMCWPASSVPACSALRLVHAVGLSTLTPSSCARCLGPTLQAARRCRLTNWETAGGSATSGPEHTGRHRHLDLVRGPPTLLVLFT